MTPERPSRPSGAPDPDRIRRRILADHGGTVRAVLAAADAVAETWDDDSAIDRSAVSGPLERELDRRDLGGPLVALLEAAVGAAGGTLAADPVAAPPYLAVTGRGPLLRATLEGGRLLVAIAAFEVRRDPVRYVRADGGPGELLEVTVRS